MSQEYSLCPTRTVYFIRALYVPKVQFISSMCSLCSWITVYAPIVQFKSSKYSLCPQSTVYVLRVQFMSLDHSLCP